MCGQHRIIPARAGFTALSGPRPRSWPDHPRSRGVYFWLAYLNHYIFRIIPARAGFTRMLGSRFFPYWDHPRSRGVYDQCEAPPRGAGGSSPLARGLRAFPLRPREMRRIIPARAGFTPDTRQARTSTTDHPRSRGVYTCGSLESQRRATLPDRVCLHCRPSARSAELR